MTLLAKVSPNLKHSSEVIFGIRKTLAMHLLIKMIFHQALFILTKLQILRSMNKVKIGH